MSKQQQKLEEPIKKKFMKRS